MKTLALWIIASRPKTWVASISPVLLGTALAYAQGQFNILLFLLTLATSMGIQITTNFANDYFDFLKGADTASRKGPLRITQAGLVSPRQMKRMVLIALAITAFSGCTLVAYGGLIISCLLALSLLFAILYTGGPAPLAYLGLGELFVFVFFGLAATGGTYFLQTGSWNLESFIAGIAPGALSTALLVLNNLRDIEEDRAARKKTLIVRFGSRFGQVEYCFCLLLSLIPIAYLGSKYPLLPITFLSFLIFVPGLSLPPLTHPLWFKKTGQLIGAYSILFCLGLYLS